ncbi:MAG: hypothetical protein ABIA93_05225 [Candidatus Woesearchaeota archaeon]
METRDYKHILVNPPEGMVIDALRTLPCMPRAAQIMFSAHPRIEQFEEALINHGGTSIGEFERLAPNVVPFQTARLDYGSNYESGCPRMTYTVHTFDKPGLAARILTTRTFPPVHINNAIIDLIAKTQAKRGIPAHFHVATPNENSWSRFKDDHFENLIAQGYIPEMGKLYLDATGESKFYEQTTGHVPEPTSFLFKPKKTMGPAHSDKIIGIAGTTGMNVEILVNQWFDELLKRHGINPEDKNNRKFVGLEYQNVE